MKLMHTWGLDAHAAFGPLLAIPAIVASAGSTVLAGSAAAAGSAARGRT